MKKAIFVILSLLPIIAFADKGNSTSAAANAFCNKLDSAVSHLESVNLALLPNAVKRISGELKVSEGVIESLASTIKDVVPNKIDYLDEIDTYYGYKSDSPKSCREHYVWVMKRKNNPMNAKNGSIFALQRAIITIGIEAEIAKAYPNTSP